MARTNDLKELEDKQRKLVRLEARLINYACSKGWGLRRACAYCIKEGHHRPGSNHGIRLAIDLCLDFPDGEGGWVYQRDSEAYRELGDFWKSLDPDCRWGGDFRGSKGRPKPDGNHFSIIYKGGQ